MMVDGVLDTDLMDTDRGPAESRSARRTLPATFHYGPDVIPGVVLLVEFVLFVAGGMALLWLPFADIDDYFPQHVFCVLFTALVYSYLVNWVSLGRLNTLMRPLANADNVIVAVVTAFMFLLSILHGLDVAYTIEMSWLACFFGVSVAAVLSGRFLAFWVLRTLSDRRIVGRNLVVLGIGEQSERFLNRIRRDPPYFTEVRGVFSLEPEPLMRNWASFPVLGNVDSLLAEARNGTVDDIVVALPWSADRTVIETVERLKELPVNVHLCSDLVGFDLAFRPVLGTFSQVPVFEVVQRPISGWSSALKKVMDYSVALALVTMLSPLLLLIAVAIRLDSPGPIFFMQPRLGFNNKPFAIYKFRSMFHAPQPETEVRQATRNDPRVTRVGRIIRATSLDELPQLFNVLNGSMSLVGPRPHALSHNIEYGQQIRGYFARHKVKPGITGWAQVNGLRGETDTVEKMRQRVEHDVYYTENWSLLFDIKILLQTAFVVLGQKTAY